jgi:putative DNA primase/helicase
MTHTVQTTGDTLKRSPVSPVVFGHKGAGKSLCFEQFALLFGNHGMTIARKDQLTGKFNRHLMLSLFVLAEEAVYAHDKAGEGPLKDMLTRKTLTIEPKNVDAFESPNYCRFAFVSNETLAIPMTQDERRYQPFEISSDY